MVDVERHGEEVAPAQVLLEAVVVVVAAAVLHQQITMGVGMMAHRLPNPQRLQQSQTHYLPGLRPDAADVRDQHTLR